MASAKGLGVLDKFFYILRTIENSDTPLVVQDIVDKTDLNSRTVQRLVSRLAHEGLVGFRVQRHTTEYKYTRKGSNKESVATRNSCGYEYYKIGR